MTPRLSITAVALALVIVGTLGAQDAEQNQRPAEQSTAEEQQEVSREARLPNGVDGSVKLLNVDNSEWRIVDAAGEGAQPALGGSLVRLRTGGRYHFDLSSVDSETLPLDIRSLNGRVLISQREGAGELDIEGVDPEADADGISFTLTEELAGQIASFRATPYPGMVGFVSSVSPESDNGEQTNQGESEENQSAGDESEQTEQG